MNPERSPATKLALSIVTISGALQFGLPVAAQWLRLVALGPIRAGEL